MRQPMFCANVLPHMMARDALEARGRRGMFGSIVVGTDGSDTAKEAVRQATELARAVDATLNVVSAYEPVPEGRLRHERQNAPAELEWSINAREDVEATLSAAAEGIEA